MAPSAYTSPFTVLNEGCRSRFLIICDHASNVLPDRYGLLGLDETELARHIAWDVGAGEIAAMLAERLGCPAVLSGFSRLLIDPNRGLDDPTLVMKVSDGSIIPGNLNVDAHRDKREWQHRVDEFYTPYHQAISTALDRSLSEGRVPIILSVHSFAPRFRGSDRPWAAAVLWDRDDRLARHLLKALRGSGHLIGDNQPYSGRLKNDCMFRHGTSRGLPHALIELRQDCLDSRAEQENWILYLMEGLRAAEQDGACGERKCFGSCTEDAF